MVSKITIFEPHFEDAQFGPASMELPGTQKEIDNGTGFLTGGGSANGDSDTGESDEGKSGLVTLFQGVTVFVVIFTLLWLVISRLNSDEDEDETS